MREINPTASIVDAKTVKERKFVDAKGRIKALAGLFKLRIVMLLLISALGGAMLGAGEWPGGSSLLLLLITGGFSAAGASALNQYLEREIDAHMVRTRRRVLPSGIVENPIWVLITGGSMIIFAVILSAIFNPALAISNALGAIIYIGVYTLWLKPRTILNIVIGGAAGSMAVISGGASVGSWNEPGVLALSLLIFTWTPTHFWSLAMAYRQDYAGAGYPMLPVNTSPRGAAWWVAIHTLATSLIAIILSFHPSLGIGYFLPVVFITYQFIKLAIRLIQRPKGNKALSLFKFSNLYLGMVLLIIIILPVIG